MVSVNETMDLWSLFVDHISGGETFFIFLSLIIITLIIAKLRMPNSVAIVIFILYGLMMSAFFPIFKVIIALVVGIFLALVFNKAFNE